MAYDGSCHCGAVTFSVAADTPTQALSCNCSICRRKGLLLAFVPRAAMTVQGESARHSYLFNTHRIRHQFCTTCGTETFAFAPGPNGGDGCAINLRCVPAIDLDALEIRHFDGASL